MKVVIDTNVLVSALLKRDSVPGRILRAVWEGSLELLLSPPLREELAAVLEYPKIKKRRVALGVESGPFLDLLPFFTTEVGIGDVAVSMPRDTDDQMVLATLVAGLGDWLITGDKDLLELQDQYAILTPVAFVERFLS